MWTVSITGLGHGAGYNLFFSGFKTSYIQNYSFIFSVIKIPNSQFPCTTEDIKLNSYQGFCKKLMIRIFLYLGSRSMGNSILSHHPKFYLFFIKNDKTECHPVIRVFTE